MIVPLTVQRHIGCVLEPPKQAVLTAHARLKDMLENLAPQLHRASGLSFYNTPPCTFESLCGDAKTLTANLKKSGTEYKVVTMTTDLERQQPLLKALVKKSFLPFFAPRESRGRYGLQA